LSTNLALIFEQLICAGGCGISFAGRLVKMHVEKIALLKTETSTAAY
jgi:hypothetical protein